LCLNKTPINHLSTISDCICSFNKFGKKSHSEARLHNNVAINKCYRAGKNSHSERKNLPWSVLSLPKGLPRVYRGERSRMGGIFLNSHSCESRNPKNNQLKELIPLQKQGESIHSFHSRQKHRNQAHVRSSFHITIFDRSH